MQICIHTYMRACIHAYTQALDTYRWTDRWTDRNTYMHEHLDTFTQTTYNIFVRTYLLPSFHALPAAHKVQDGEPRMVYINLSSHERPHNGAARILLPKTASKTFSCGDMQEEKYP